MYADFSSTSVRGREEAVSILRPIGSFKSCLPDHKQVLNKVPILQYYKMNKYQHSHNNATLADFEI